MTATDRLDAIEARARAAAEGPWTVDRVESSVLGEYWTVESPSGVKTPFAGCALSNVECVTLPDATFIAYARTDVPALVAALRGVLRVHAPKWTQGGHICRACGAFLDDDRPDCPTVAAITAALTEVTA